MSTGTLYVIGVDPGKQTGVAIYGNGRFIMGDDMPASEVGLFVDAYIMELRSQDPDSRIVMACERFNVGGSTLKMTRQADATEVTGKMRDIAKKHGITLVIQNAADAKKMGAPVILRSIGWWTPRKRHANDAAAHALLMLSSASLDEYKVARFPV